MSRRVDLLALFVLPLLLAGCAAEPGGDAVSPECQSLIDELADVEPGDVEAEDEKIADAVYACKSAAEFIEAVKVTPGAFYYDDPAAVERDQSFILIAACLRNPVSPVCKDADAQGLLD